MNDTDIFLLLIVKSEKHRSAYLSALDLPGVRVVVSPSFSMLPAEAVDQAFHGVLVDLPTKIHALKAHRDFVYRILGSFPMAQLNVDRRTGRISVFYHGRDEQGSLEDFVFQKCRRAAPRRFRQHHRKKAHFHVYVSGIRAGSDLKSTTIDISQGGCFIYATDTCPAGTVLTLSFTALAADQSIQAEVRHQVPWGTPSRLSGFGLAFKDNASESLKALTALAGIETAVE